MKNPAWQELEKKWQQEKASQTKWIAAKVAKELKNRRCFLNTAESQKPKANIAFICGNSKLKLKTKTEN